MKQTGGIRPHVGHSQTETDFRKADKSLPVLFIIICVSSGLTNMREHDIPSECRVEDGNRKGYCDK